MVMKNTDAPTRVVVETTKLDPIVALTSFEGIEIIDCPVVGNEMPVKYIITLELQSESAANHLHHFLQSIGF